MTAVQTEIYNRPAKLKAIYGDTAEVMFTDTSWTLDYVPVSHLPSGALARLQKVIDDE